MASLHHDLHTRRIYEVPENSTYTVDVDGYFVYTPLDVETAEKVVTFTNFDLWSRFVDYHFLNEWSTLAYDYSGGAFIETDENGNDRFDPFSLRLINDWEFVPANYPHLLKVDGNVRPQFGTDTFFDKDRLTNFVETEVILAQRSQSIVINGLSQSEIENIASLMAPALASQILQQALNC